MKREFAQIIPPRVLKKLAKKLHVNHEGPSANIVKSILTNEHGLGRLKRKLIKQKRIIDAALQQDLLDILNDLGVGFVQKAKFVRHELTNVQILASKGAGGSMNPRRLEKDYGFLPGVAIAFKQRVNTKDAQNRQLVRLMASN